MKSGVMLLGAGAVVVGLLSKQLGERRALLRAREEAPAQPVRAKAKAVADAWDVNARERTAPAQDLAAQAAASMIARALRGAPGALRQLGGTSGRGDEAVLADDASDRRDSLEGLWSTEASDADWTTDARRYLEGAIADARLPADVLGPVECRESLCRMHFRFRAPQEAVQLFELRQPDFDVEYFADGHSFVVFAAREGESLKDIAGGGAPSLQESAH